MRRTVIASVCLLIAAPALAQSVGEKTGVNSVLGVTPNAAAEEFLSDDLKNAYKAGYAPNDAMMPRLEWIVRNDQTSAFTDLWTAVKGE